MTFATLPTAATGPGGPSSRESGEIPLAEGRRGPSPGHAGPNEDSHQGARELVERLFISAGGPDRQTAVLFAAVDRHGAAGEMCGRVAEALAACSDGFVCVVDADLRQPTLDQYFRTAATPGLGDVLQDGCGAREVALQVRPNLWFVPAGSALVDPLLLFGSGRARSLFRELREVFKYVLVHTAPLGGSEEALLLGPLTDGVVLVVEAHRTHREKARRVKDRLQTARVPLLGVVLTNRRLPIPPWLSRWL